MRSAMGGGIGQGTMIFNCSMTEPGLRAVTDERQRIFILRANVN